MVKKSAGVFQGMASHGLRRPQFGIVRRWAGILATASPIGDGAPLLLALGCGEWVIAGKGSIIYIRFHPFFRSYRFDGIGLRGNYQRLDPKFPSPSAVGHAIL